MAKIKFGMMMTDARGKLGGQVFSKNRGGAYVRTKVTPSNPRTTDQQTNRAILGSLSQGWSALTEAERLSWNSAVGNWLTTNIFGDSIKPSGKNLYIKLNKNLAYSGQATILNAPDKVEMPILNFSSVTVDTAVEKINLVFNAVPAGFRLSVSATPNLSAGTYNFKNQLRTIFSSATAGFTPNAIYAAYIAKYGTPVVGGNVQFELKIVADNGQLSVPEVQKAEVS